MSEFIYKELFDNAMRNKWKEVEKIYRKFPEGASVKITTSGETALHLAVLDRREDILEQLIEALGFEKAKAALNITNEFGDTPLHFAAAMGNIPTCKCITKVDEHLVDQRNNERCTPLFLTALLGKMEAFFFLRGICGPEDIKKHRGKYGEAILHTAISGEFFKLALFIVDNHPELISIMEERGLTPFHVLARMPSVFRSGIYFGCLANIVYSCITVKELPNQSDNHTGITVLQDQIDHPTGFKDMKFVCDKLMLSILGLGFEEIKEIKRIKENHVWSLQMVEKLLNNSSYNYDAGGRSGSSPTLDFDIDCISEFPPQETNQNAQDGNAKPETKLDRKETPMLAAARYGITEIVKLILDHFPFAIHDRNSKNKNMVLLAAQHRQPQLFALFKEKKIEDDVYHAWDIDGNSALHLAANYKVLRHPWTIPGAALQMQWEIKWFEYVKSCVKPDHLMLRNKEGKHARSIFTETHRDLVKEGGEWLRKTSDSCSVVAALIATVAFAASATVPGSTEKGKPILEKDLAFQVFSISSLVSLCFSVTSLVMFLSILTSRYKEHEFRLGLPTKLLLGMSSLLISIAAVLVSFCTGHFFILNDQLRSVAVPIYAVTCLPATLFALGHLPLYIDLISAIFTKVPLALYNGRFAESD